MRKHLLFLLTASWCSLPMTAQQIAPDEALDAALAALHNGRSHAPSTFRQPDQFRLVGTQTSTTLRDTPLLYVFQHSAGGLLLTSADQKTTPLIGVVESGTYDDALGIPAFRYWMDESLRGLEEHIGSGRHSEHTADLTLRDTDGNILYRTPARHRATSALPAFVAPLLADINWNQDAPYNAETPMYDASSNSATGCVATAASQIMKYYEWPVQPTGTVSYTWTNRNTGAKRTLQHDYASSTYDWGPMLDDYEHQNYNAEQAQEVAKLMRDVGYSASMQYGSSSSAYAKDILNGLTTHFHYSRATQFCDRDYYTSDEWTALIHSEIADGRPVYMGGTNFVQNTGHAFVLDGYNTLGLIHVNWGWGGMSNGYFNLDYMHPNSQGTGGSQGGYAGGQQIFAGLQPDYDDSSIAVADMIQKESIYYNETAKRLQYSAYNYGLGAFNGYLGMRVLRKLDDGSFQLVKERYYVAKDYKFLVGSKIYYTYDQLGITPASLGVVDGEWDGSCLYVVPACKANDEFVAMRSPVYTDNCIKVFYNTDTGAIDWTYADNDFTARPYVESAEIVHAYSGYDIKLRTVISNPEGCSEYNQKLSALIYNADGKQVAAAHNYRVIRPGASEEIVFSCDASRLPNGEYTFAIAENINDVYIPLDLGDLQQHFSLSTPGPSSLSYSNYTPSSTKCMEKMPFYVDFDVINRGGYDCREYVVFFFRSGQQTSCSYVGHDKYEIEPGATRLHVGGMLDIPAGTYTYLLKDRTKNENRKQGTITVYPFGDINYDNSVDNDDATLYRDILLGRKDNESDADFNRDGRTTILDLAKFIKFIKE